MAFSSTSLISAWLDPLGESALFSDEEWMKAMLRFEAQLALAHAECGLIPHSAAQAIEQACANVSFDLEKMIAKARQTGALGMAVIEPLQQWLREYSPEGLAWLHWGTTTQDVVDTANALLTSKALIALQQQLEGLQLNLQRMAQVHARTPILGRSLLQPAQITSFGLKCAQAAAAVDRSRKHLRQLAEKALCVQLGGAVGNNAVLGTHAIRVEQVLARRLGLSACGHSWHTQRDAWMRLGMEVAVCGGTLAKLAKDWTLLSQYEVGELRESTRGPTSSAMPHKRNSVHCMQAVAQTRPVAQLAATLLACMEQAHERALGEWQAETVHWVQLWTHVHAAAAALNLAAQGMEIDATRMQANVESLHGVVFSEAITQVLIPLLGKPAAQCAVAHCSEQALLVGQALPKVITQYLEQQGYVIDADLSRELQTTADFRIAAQLSALKCQDLLTSLKPTFLSSYLSETVL